jgi:glycosyltransferase involved in cell wall biosynthesis
MKETIVSFIGSVVPDTPEYVGPGFSRAGNLAQIGFLEAISTSGMRIGTVLSSQPVAHFPKGRVLIQGSRKVEVLPGLHETLVPLLNIFIVRDILRALYIYCYVFLWSLRHFGKRRIVITYNVGVPPVLPLQFIASLTGTKVTSIIYDIVPAAAYNKGIRKLLFYDCVMRLGQWAIPRLSGRIVITDPIAERFGGGKHYLRVDGGVTQAVVDRLFPLLPAETGQDLVLFFAGGINEWNHVPMLLEMMRTHPDARLQLWFAGSGASLPLVREAASRDSRIVYHGMLDLDQLFELYKRADVLLNLRNSSDPTMKYHFPSKLLEILAVGKPVLTTSITHIKAVYGDYCFILEDETLDGLFRVVQAISELGPVKRFEMGARARAFMLREYTWKAQGARIRAYLEGEVAGRK